MMAPRFAFLIGSCWLLVFLPNAKAGGPQGGAGAPKERATVEGFPFVGSALMFTPNSKVIAISGWIPLVNAANIGAPRPKVEGEGDIRVWSLAKNGAVTSLRAGDYSYVRCLEISPDGTILASGNASGVVRLWDLNTYKEIK